MRKLSIIALSAWWLLGVSLAPAASDFQFTLGGDGFNTDYILASVSSAEVYAGALPANDPTINLIQDRRYGVTNTTAAMHPFEVIAVGAADTVLLSQGAVVGALEADPSVQWSDSGTGLIEFTVSQALIDAMTEGGDTPGYRCKRHPAQMRGPFALIVNGPPQLGIVTDNLDGTIHMTWTNPSATPAQFLGLAYDIYAAQFVPRGYLGSIWYPFLATASEGDLDLFYSGGYFAWILNQYADFSWYACPNPWAGIMFSGTPHTPTGVTATEPATLTVSLQWDPDIYGTCMYQIAAYRTDDGSWPNTTGPDGTHVWHAIVFPTAPFLNGSAPFTVPSPGNYRFWIRGVSWLGSLGGWGFALVNVI